MQAYLIFGADNSHPLAWLLNKQHRHVWCILADIEHQTWVSYDWGQGLPELRTEASLDFDIQGHYESHGYDVVAIPDDEREAVQGFYVLNNCVGHVKSVLGIRGISFVPHQLYKQVTKRKPRPRQGIRGLSFVSHHFYKLVTLLRGAAYRRCRVKTRQQARKARVSPRQNRVTVPGFGGSRATAPAPLPPLPPPLPPPPPPAPPPPPRKPQFERNREAEARTGSADRQRRINAAKKTSAGLLSNDTPDTLL